FDSVEQEEVSDDRVLSPITGKLLDNKVAHGSQVSKGDVVLVLEAMKMEHRLTAPRDGKIASITGVEIGGQVKEGDFMFELEDE
ncbi:MAG: biotin/lipoyl-containing protein, partial [Candidatus Thermoplasmatota archaeon]|nr:biotin/lipoyl-containing protein [Candidatus Thermoplasmatota archaeon]